MWFGTTPRPGYRAAGNRGVTLIWGAVRCPPWYRLQCNHPKRSWLIYSLLPFIPDPPATNCQIFGFLPHVIVRFGPPWSSAIGDILRFFRPRHWKIITFVSEFWCCCGALKSLNFVAIIIYYWRDQMCHSKKIVDFKSGTTTTTSSSSSSCNKSGGAREASLGG